MQEENQDSRLNDDSRMRMSRLKNKKKGGSKLSQYETNMENFVNK